MQKNVNKLSGSQYPVTQFLWTNFSDFWLNIVQETLKLEWQCSQYHELNPTCVPVRCFDTNDKPLTHDVLRSIHTMRVRLRFLDILTQTQRMGYIPILCIDTASS